MVISHAGKMLMLDDDDRTWFAAIIGSARARPDFTSLGFTRKLGLASTRP
jgi:hypothetical protein